MNTAMTEWERNAAAVSANRVASLASSLKVLNEGLLLGGLVLLVTWLESLVPVMAEVAEDFREDRGDVEEHAWVMGVVRVRAICEDIIMQREDSSDAELVEEWRCRLYALDTRLEPHREAVGWLEAELWNDPELRNVPREGVWYAPLPMISEKLISEAFSLEG